MYKRFCLFLFVLFFFSFVYSQTQVHLSVQSQDIWNILWVTPLEGGIIGTQPMVQWSTTSGYPYEYSSNAEKNSYSYINSYHYYNSGLLYNTSMNNLNEGIKYYYRVGYNDINQWSTEFSFNVPYFSSVNSNYQSIIGFTADMGVKRNSMKTVNGLKISNVDIVIHPGDVCYPDDDEDPYWGEHAWDIWNNMVEPVASNVPWMIAPGSHELYNNNTAYNLRYRYPTGRIDNCYYSWDWQNIHFIALCSEGKACASYLPNSEQYNWLENDLKNINRSITPWIIAFWHRPWYSSNADSDAKEGIAMKESMEDLLYSYNISLVVNGHIHAYERTFNVYKNKLNNNGIPYITIGGGGESLYSTWLNPQPDWSSYRTANYSFGILNIKNDTHGLWEMHLLDPLNNYPIIDSTWFYSKK